jgi:hypothetical protein
MINRILIAALVLICSCNSTNTQNVNNGLTTKESNSMANGFFSSIKELNLPISYAYFTDYLTKVDKENDYSPYLINAKMLIGKNIYFCESFEISALQNCKVYSFNTEKEITSLIEGTESGTLIIPIFKTTVCNCIILGYLSYVQGETDTKFASIKIRAYTKEGALLSNEPLSLFYVGGGEGGDFMIKSSINNDCIITMKRTDRTDLKETTSGDIEHSDKPQITKETHSFKISESGINEIK